MFSAQDNHFDVLIVGAGPSGTSCAYMLRHSGLKVAVLEKTSFPRDKTCGDAMSMDTINQFELMDPHLSEKFELLTEKIPSYGVSIFSPKGYKVEMPIYKNGQKKCGYVCKRYVLDNFLFEQIKGFETIQIFQDTEVKKINFETHQVIVETTSGIFYTKLIVGADGAHSVVNRMTGSIPVDKKAHSAGLRMYYENVTGFHDENFIELHFFREILPGYLWIFKLPNGQANVGVALPSNVISQKKINLKEAFKHLIETHPSLKPRFENARPLETVKGYGLPLGSKKRKLSGNRFLLLGDAGSLIDPFSGEGIANAVRSGRVAADTIRSSFDQNDFSASFLKSYDKELYRRIWMELNVSQKLQRLCRYPWLFDFIVKRVEKSDYLKQFMNDALRDVHHKKIITGPMFFYHLFIKR